MGWCYLVECLCCDLILESLQVVCDYFKVCLCYEQYEVFVCLFFDMRYWVLVFEVLFQGSIDGVSVYLCQVVKCILVYNVVVLILIYNYFFGDVCLSFVDCQFIVCFKEVLVFIDVWVFDYFIIGDGELLLLVEYGWL